VAGAALSPLRGRSSTLTGVAGGSSLRASLKRSILCSWFTNSVFGSFAPNVGRPSVISTILSGGGERAWIALNALKRLVPWSGIISERRASRSLIFLTSLLLIHLPCSLSSKKWGSELKARTWKSEFFARLFASHLTISFVWRHFFAFFFFARSFSNCSNLI